MTVGSWDPNANQKTIPVDALSTALNFTDEHSFPSEPNEQLVLLQPFVKVKQGVWQPVLKTFHSDQLKALCRFFTLAEKNWPEWFGGDKNPVIWICKELKQRGDFPDKDLTMWIKQNTDNRFLPYGNILG